MAINNREKFSNFSSSLFREVRTQKAFHSFCPEGNRNPRSWVVRSKHFEHFTGQLTDYFWEEMEKKKKEEREKNI